MYTLAEVQPFIYGLFSEGNLVGHLSQNPFPSKEAQSKATELCVYGGAEKPISEHVSFVGDIHKVSDIEFAIRVLNRTTRDHNIRYYIV